MTYDAVMKTTILLTLFSLLCPTVHAGDLPGMTMSTYCSVRFGSGPMVDSVLHFFALKDFNDSGEDVRRAMAAKVTNDFVKPAVQNGCRDKGLNGWSFLKNVAQACEFGCDQAISGWPDLRAEARSYQISICKADCRAGMSMLTGMAIGYDTAQGK